MKHNDLRRVMHGRFAGVVLRVGEISGNRVVLQSMAGGVWRNLFATTLEDAEHHTVAVDDSGPDVVVRRPGRYRRPFVQELRLRALNKGRRTR